MRVSVEWCRGFAAHYGDRQGRRITLIDLRTTLGVASTDSCPNLAVRDDRAMDTSDESLFTEHATTGLVNLVQYNEHFMNGRFVAVGYADAASRLEMSFQGEPWDDVMLLPFLFLWRQAIELQLKTNIRDLAKLRRRQGETEEWLRSDVVDERLRNPRKVGHDLAELIAEHDQHNIALGLQAIPADVFRTLELFAALDNGGTGFRYAGVLKAPSADLNFRSLAESLDEAFKLLQVVIDAATSGEGV